MHRFQEYSDCFGKLWCDKTDLIPIENIKVPFHFMMGENDVICPYEVQKQYIKLMTTSITGKVMRGRQHTEFSSTNDPEMTQELLSCLAGE